MDKKKRNLVIGISVLFGLIIIYSIVSISSKKQFEDEQLSTNTEEYVLTDRTIDELDKIILSSNNEEIYLDLVYRDPETGADTWSLESNPDLPLDMYYIDSIAGDLAHLVSYEKLPLQENQENFGFEENRKATAVYNDGTQDVIYIGSITSDNKNYYIKVNDSEEIYLVPKSTGDLLLSDVNSVVMKNLPYIDMMNFRYLSVKQPNKQEIEISTPEPTGDTTQSYPMPYMVQPIEGTEVYFDNLYNEVLVDMSSMVITELVDENPENLEQYGLEEPSLEIVIRDSLNENHILLGNEVPESDNLVYMKYADSNEVYTIDQVYFESLYNFNVFDVIQPNIVLENMEDVNDIQITTNSDNYDIQLNKVITEEVVTEASDTTPAETMQTLSYNVTINGIPIEENIFKEMYISIVSLRYEAFVNPSVELGNEEVNIVYNFDSELNRDSVNVRFFDYNNDYYAVQINDEPITMITDKQSVNTLLDTLNEAIT